jgi:hypothetical protein
MAILTNLPKSGGRTRWPWPCYQRGWTLETMFQSLTTMFQGELATLGYPRNRSVRLRCSLAAYNVLSTVQAALRASSASREGFKRKSGCPHRDEVRASGSGGYRGRTSRLGGVPDDDPRVTLAKELRRWATHVKLQSSSAIRAEPKPVPKRTQHVDSPHVSTAQLLSKFRGSDLEGLPLDTHRGAAVGRDSRSVAQGGADAGPSRPRTSSRWCCRLQVAIAAALAAPAAPTLGSTTQAPERS